MFKKMFFLPTWAIVNAVLPFFPKTHRRRKGREHPWIPLSEWVEHSTSLAHAFDLALWAYTIMLFLTLITNHAYAYDSNNAPPMGPAGLDYTYKPDPRTVLSRHPKVTPVPVTGVRQTMEGRGPHGLSCGNMHYTYVLSPTFYLAGDNRDGNANSYYGAYVTVRQNSKIVFQDAGLLEDTGAYSSLKTARYTFETGYKGNGAKVTDNASKRCLCSDGSVPACPAGTVY